MTFGAEKSTIDCRDFRLTNIKKAKLPTEYLPTKELPKVKNQYYTSSCVAHAISSILEWNNDSKVALSTQWIYACKKLITDKTSVGMSVKDGCKIAVNYGDVRMAMCPGNDEFPVCYNRIKYLLESDSTRSYAYKYHAEYYVKLATEKEIKFAITKDLLPIICMKWYSDFKLDSDGVISATYKGTANNHAVFIYGYNEKGYLCQNSWGEEFGNGGRFVLPYKIATKVLVDAYALVDCTENEIHKPHKNCWSWVISLLNSMRR